jgi:hypothetical protein
MQNALDMAEIYFNPLNVEDGGLIKAKLGR